MCPLTFVPWAGVEVFGARPVEQSLRMLSLLLEGLTMDGWDRDLTLERRYDVSPRNVWTAWSTADSVAAWWGPHGYSTTVQVLEARTGGCFQYVMTAVAPEQIRFADRHGLSRSTTVIGRFVDVVAPASLTIAQLVDFVPGVCAYEVSASLEVLPVRSSQSKSRIRLKIGRMHDDQWTERSLDGWRAQLRRLAVHLRDSRG